MCEDEDVEDEEKGVTGNDDDDDDDNLPPCRSVRHHNFSLRSLRMVRKRRNDQNYPSAANSVCEEEGYDCNEEEEEREEAGEQKGETGEDNDDVPSDLARRSAKRAIA